MIQDGGEYVGDVVEYFVLDDEANPLGLRSRRTSGSGEVSAVTRVVEISYREPTAVPSSSPLERALLARSRAGVYDHLLRLQQLPDRSLRHRRGPAHHVRSR
jgi:hypothetical protein